MFLVCGDSMEDVYITGETTRISPEAPVPVVKVKDSITKPGGAANVLNNVLALNEEARGLYSIAAGYNPVQKLRVISGSQQVVRLDYDHYQTPIRAENFTPEEWIIFSDYGKGSLDHIQDLIRLSPASTIFVDPKGVDYERYAGSSYIKPNKDEMRDLVGGWSSEAQLDTKAFNVVHKFALKGLLLTRGSEGMTLYTATTKHHEPSVVQEVYDVCGAGDTSISTFAVAISRGFSHEEAVHLAIKAAGITCQHLGAYSPTFKEVFQ